LMQVVAEPETYREALRITEEENDWGARLVPMVGSRAATVLTSLATYNVFALRPTYHRLPHLPLEDLLAELQLPESTVAVLNEPNALIQPPGARENNVTGLFEAGMHLTFPLQEPLDYEPSVDESVAARADAQGCDRFGYLYDFLLQDDGHSV